MSVCVGVTLVPDLRAAFAIGDVESVRFAVDTSVVILLSVKSGDCMLHFVKSVGYDEEHAFRD